MSPLRLFAATAVFFSSYGVALAGQESQSQGAWPRDVLNSLPMVYFHANERKEAALHWLDPELQHARIDGQTYLGFHFWTTVWHDGPVEWMLASSEDEGNLQPWTLIDGEGNPITTIIPEKRSPDAHPRITERFPETSAITYGVVPQEHLEARSQYYLIRPQSDESTARHAALIAIDSERGRKEFGARVRKTTREPKWQSSDFVVATAAELARTDGIDAAKEYLTQEIEKRMDHWEEGRRMKPEPEDQMERWWAWQILYFASYREAQVGGGRLDNNWSIELYETLLEVTKRRRYYREMVDVTANTINALAAGGRFGRQAELLGEWAELMQQSGYQMSPSAYPDRGQAFAILPQVRKREIPVLVPLANIRYGHRAPWTRPVDSKLNFSTFAHYSNSRWSAGHWQEALEWDAWQLADSSNPDDGEPLGNRANNWHRMISELIHRFNYLGYHEEALALCDRALSAKHDGWYHGRYPIMHARKRLEILMEIDRTEPEFVAQMQDLVQRADANMFMRRHGHGIDVSLARALLKTGRIEEGEALMETLIAEGKFNARWLRITHWLEQGRVDGVEDELIAMLHHVRESGGKLNEITLYSMYADFLESQGRYSEALRIRRETIRLCRVFNLFTRLPVEVSKLARLLRKSGNEADALLAANDARALLGDTSLPPRRIEMALAALAEFSGMAPVVSAPAIPRNTARVEFQPRQSIVIPIADRPWKTLFTLANPGDQLATGTLHADGMPAVITADEAGQSHATVTLTADGEALSLPFDIESGAYRLVGVTSEGASEGELTLVWKPADGGEPATSRVIIETAEEGVAGALIEAGEYQANPFYGVPIHHFYVAADGTTQSLPLRFITSSPARVEIYDFDGGLLAIDAQGNGSLHDRADELHASSDGKGNLVLDLTDQSVHFMILLYPAAPLEKEGVSLRIEARDGNEWLLFAEDRLKP